jgi:phosphotriesterase-related protein
MATVETVTGPIDANELGPTLVHEHFYFSYPGDKLDPADDFDRERCIEVALERVGQVQEYGVRTWIDPTPIECGRDPELLAEISQRTGLNVVCATGFYHEHIGLPYYWRVRNEDEIYELYMHELTEGIDGTGIKPGIVKVASGDPVTDQERKVIRAAGRAAAETGATIVTHCENASGWDVQQDLLAEVGMDLGRCLIGHQDQAVDASQVVKIAERGSFVGIDRIGFEVLAPEEQRVGLVKALLEAGHQDRVCLSQDHMCCLRSAKFPYPVPPGIDDDTAAQLEPWVRDQMYGRSHSYLFTDFRPKLSAAEIDDATFDSIMTDNPRRLFGG